MAKWNGNEEILFLYLKRNISPIDIKMAINIYNATNRMLAKMFHIRHNFYRNL